MNTRPVIETSSNPVALSAAFNHDRTCFSVGLESGFCVYNSDPCQLRVARDLNAGVGAVEMLGRANYVALVGGGKLPKFSQNKVIIWDDAKQKVAITLECRSAVLRVRLSRNRIVVVLHNSVHVYNFSSPPERISVSETADNPLGLCCLSSSLLAFPGRTPGQVQLVEVVTGNVTIVPAHASPLRAIEISPDGEIMATASETVSRAFSPVANLLINPKGTLIRVFTTSNCARVAELRRGVDHATIFSIAISPSSQLLAVTSDKSTLHVFDIPHPTKPARLDASIATRRLTSMGSGGSLASPDDSGSQKWGILGKIPLLPRVFSDVYSFASAHFEIGDEITGGGPQDLVSKGSKTEKGVIGWTSEQSLIVIGAGRDARWEKYVVAEGEDGKRYCVRDGWKRYLGTA
ncbi:MAG: Phosphatidylinositol 3,5-bisphosphate-binding protein [Claussenomyces sp. TS43310]|nr:MAG: Phosphatidylinositol 3,5-bisphosphate-binding protein [Claussenomyces sp. TS43310]